MSYVTQSLAAQSAILRANSAEMAAINASQAQQGMIGRGGDFNSVARNEARIEADKLRAETQAKAARAELNSLKQKGRKLNFYA